MQCVRQYGKDFYRLKRFLRCARCVRLVHSVQGCRADLVLAPPSHARAAAVRRQSSWSTSTGQSTARSVPCLRMMATLARSDHGGQSTWGGCTTRSTRERSMLTTEDEACVVRLRLLLPPLLFGVVARPSSLRERRSMLSVRCQLGVSTGRCVGCRASEWRGTSAVNERALLPAGEAFLAVSPRRRGALLVLRVTVRTFCCACPGCELHGSDERSFFPRPGPPDGSRHLCEPRRAIFKKSFTSRALYNHIAGGL